MNILEIKNPRFCDANNTSIECEVLFEEFSPEWLPFAAQPNDIEAHGREIFSRCLSGEFGAIDAYIPLSDDILSKQIRAQRKTLLAASDWTQLSDVPQDTKQAWAIYRQKLREITNQSGFPLSITWPAKPAS